LAAGDEGHVVSGGMDGTVRLWALHNPDDSGRDLGRHAGGGRAASGAVSAVAVTGDGLVVSSGADGTVLMWDRHNPDDPGRELTRHDGGIRAMAVTDHGLLD